MRDERGAKRVREHERGLIRFLTPRARRYYGDLEQDLSLLRHSRFGRIGWDDFDSRYQIPAGLSSLRDLGAPDTCYVMATLANFGPPHPLDAQLVPLAEAVAQLVDEGAAIISCIPGELVYVQEDSVIYYGNAGVFRRQPRN